MNKQTFDLGWEYTEATGFFSVAFAQWQPVNLPHDLSIHKARHQSYPTGSGGAMPGVAWSPIERNSSPLPNGVGKVCSSSWKAST